MNFRDSNQDSTGTKYVTKKVMINGQFVTLYSANGQTWVSSPEDIPALMERLDSARVSLNTAERVAEGEGSKAAEPEPKKKEEPQAPPERILSTKYRVKGPKPRPILRQDGVVIKGTPIDPVSASSTVMSFSSDVKEPEHKAGGKSAKSSKTAPEKPKKLIAPVVTKKQAKVAAQPKAAGKAGPTKNTGSAPEVHASKAQKTPQLSKAGMPSGTKALAAKSAATKPAQKAPAKPVAKPSAKPVAKKATAKSQKQVSKHSPKKAKSAKKPSSKRAR